MSFRSKLKAGILFVLALAFVQTASFSQTSFSETSDAEFPTPTNSIIEGGCLVLSSDILVSQLDEASPEQSTSIEQATDEAKDSKTKEAIHVSKIDKTYYDIYRKNNPSTITNEEKVPELPEHRKPPNTKKP